MRKIFQHPHGFIAWVCQKHSEDIQSSDDEVLQPEEKDNGKHFPSEEQDAVEWPQIRQHEHDGGGAKKAGWFHF